ncbi:Ger(x)C family spore germination protein [Anoxybacillus sp. LAT_38]|uniref:Ger(x)C family spore germination protein n=1 Tax=Anoxybacillus sp. LAT_26 TaxID=2862719 RepID=UPI001EEBA3DC|nr:Ger(x)C family spore germination protein [Anoxybacillus sp. LAT_26]MCG6182306.1 Ger(x)C family spore germination protein [Anoxybacillus sp. LAT_26]MCG6196147.1 Ger(x)C family spore germination protein [Anoxybacillus sp. LAT_38]
MRTNLLFYIIFCLSFFLSGCWNIKEIQDINYVTAIGIDLDEEKKEFIVFAQVLDFSNVAKLEGGFPEKSPPIWIGQRRGKTIQAAIDSLTKEAQQRLFWGHISAIILSEHVLKTHLKQAIDFVNRYREIRYNIWLFSTKESIDRIFQAKSFFKLSALSNILHEPNELYKQHSVIRPVRFFEYLADASPAKKTVYIPSLSLSTKTWKSDDQPQPLLKISGAHFLINHYLQGWLSESKLLGMRWLDRKMEKSSVIVVEKEEPLASITIENLRISTKVKGDQIFLHISGKGIMNEKIKSISLKEIKNKTENIISTEIWHTYRQGLKIHADVLNVNEWIKKNKVMGKPKIIFPYQLADVSVDIHIISTGKLKNL